MTARAEDLVRLAARKLARGERLDLSTLAAEAGISRATLFRRVGNREDLLGDALWRMSERTLSRAVRRWEETAGPVVRDTEGQLRCLTVMGWYRADVAAANGLRVLLDSEPTTAIRVLTDPHGRVQPKVMAAYRELLARDVADGGFTPVVDLDSLSFALVRLGESFLYSDMVAAGRPNLEAAAKLLGVLVEGAPVPVR
ncbi:QsdR family transcriptional regulator [Amycolatopsis magusensis]|uniref:AcrR family transcriptional regulator n=1 Tax=Amycolatopsis magusensis TaxID=882444 RepID=A0ABS4PUX2_9PSEU|nr:QsdR family transcriptional regulator [Amycolatopsis magusensis]MBP2183226.1 AcrR family transcriptional regulator [Amycolatopsis magusensis]MDI5977489.1 QsdR family transcriptional regulator [Amycolatopsis magusensis]